MKRIGVFICHCGVNIARTVDVERVTEELRKKGAVVVAENYSYMCSDPGQDLIRKAIKEHSLDGVVVAACSPTLHENTYMRVMTSVGKNKYCFQMANIREQCSWVHNDREKATAKAITITKAAVAKAKLLHPLEDFAVEVNPNALVIGGGIAGIQAALDIAEAGHKVHLVERTPSIGGHMAQLDKTFPTLDCSACILTPKMVDVSQHPNITLHTYSEVEEVDGYVGNFSVKIKEKARFVNAEKCTGCGECMTACPVVNIPDIQPVPKYSAAIESPELKKLDKIISAYPTTGEEILIQVLQDINNEYNYLPAHCLKYVSEVLTVPLSRVYRVATFYTGFSLEPRGEHLIKVCMGTACHSRGAPQVLSRLEQVLGIKAGQTTEDEKFTLHTVGCLGCCALGPVVAIDDDYHQMTSEKVEKIIESYV